MQGHRFAKDLYINSHCQHVSLISTRRNRTVNSPCYTCSTSLAFLPVSLNQRLQLLSWRIPSTSNSQSKARIQSPSHFDFPSTPNSLREPFKRRAYTVHPSAWWSKIQPGKTAHHPRKSTSSPATGHMTTNGSPYRSKSTPTFLITQQPFQGIGIINTRYHSTSFTNAPIKTPRTRYRCYCSMAGLLHTTSGPRSSILWQIHPTSPLHASTLSLPTFQDSASAPRPPTLISDHVKWAWPLIH